METSESEDEYEATWERNLARKQALFALLGVDNLISEGRQLLAKNREDREIQQRVPKRTTKKVPARRSTRIQEKCLKVKYVRGFKGFESDTDTESYALCESSASEPPMSSINVPRSIIKETSKFQNSEHLPFSEESCLNIIKYSFRRSFTFEELDSEDDWSNYEEVNFIVSTTDDSDDSDDPCNDIDFDSRRRRVPRLTKFSYVSMISSEDVTEEMISNIAKRSSGKVYDQVHGTTCHQCRQKTSDTKTVCRSGRCIGVRGMFCGVCLPKRYGEQVADALKNPLWECPVCRGTCNCSFCRARAGKNPTGIMYPEARQNGYNCVAEYLQDRDEGDIQQKIKKIKVIAVNHNCF